MILHVTIRKFVHSAMRPRSQCRRLYAAVSERSALIQKACADVHVIPLLEDNYSYIVVDRKTGVSAVVDPGLAPPVIKKIADLRQFYSKFELKYVLCTHKHWDHVQGNEALKQSFPAALIVSSAFDRAPMSEVFISHREHLQIGDLNAEVIHTPCHTRGHICFHITGTSGSGILFSGDTLFVGGCGRFFEGSADDMLKNMNMFSALPGDTQVYCGHEYTVSNLNFLKTIAPDEVKNFLLRANELRRNGCPTVPTTIREELAYNLFMKCNEIKVQNMLFADSATAAITKLREMKNMF